MNKYTLAKQKTLAELCVHKDEQLKALQEEVKQLREAACAYSDAVVFMDIDIDGRSINAEGLLPTEVVANLNTVLCGARQ